MAESETGLSDLMEGFDLEDINDTIDHTYITGDHHHHPNKEHRRSDALEIHVRSSWQQGAVVITR